MRFLVYVIVFLFIILETSIFGKFPYYAMALSFLGYVAYSKEVNAIWYTVPVVLIVGISASNIEQFFIFFAIYVFLLNQIYRHILFDQINIFLITVIEVVLYLTFIYLFKVREIDLAICVKEFIFVLLYNFIFYYFDRLKTKRE